MKFRRILPAAAGVIALTATVAFARDYKDAEETEGLRIRVSERASGGNAASSTASIPFAIDSETGMIYQVEITRGGKSNVVLIEAHTGRVIRGKNSSDETA